MVRICHTYCVFYKLFTLVSQYQNVICTWQIVEQHFSITLALSVSNLDPTVVMIWQRHSMLWLTSSTDWPFFRSSSCAKLDNVLADKFGYIHVHYIVHILYIHVHVHVPLLCSCEWWLHGEYQVWRVHLYYSAQIILYFNTSQCLSM
jgi:hypothetical protein